MEFEAKYITPDIKLSSYADKFFKSDIIFDQHMLVWFISGETKIVQADTIHILKKEIFSLFPEINWPLLSIIQKMVSHTKRW